MLEAIMETLRIMGWLGIVLGILATVNLVCGTIYNINDGQTFSWKKFLDSGKVAIFASVKPSINIKSTYNATLY